MNILLKGVRAVVGLFLLAGIDLKKFKGAEKKEKEITERFKQNWNRFVDKQ